MTSPLRSSQNARASVVVVTMVIAVGSTTAAWAAPGDEDGTGHFDDGSAIYYARVVANRLARCGRYESVRVNVRDAGGRLLTIVVPGCCLPAAAHRARIRTIVENDLARQRLAAAA